MNDQQHRSVLLHESVAALNIKKDGIIVDGTFGRGGHAKAILKELGKAGSLYAIDRDPEAIAAGTGLDSRLVLAQRSFASLGEWLQGFGLLGRVDGILLDLGVSSPQLDDPARGFSFLRDGPLDMRMDTTQGETAEQWISHSTEQEIAQVIKEYGEERYAKAIARRIVAERQDAPFQTTNQLATLVAGIVPKEKHKHPATRTFQGIRLFINQELQALKAFLPQSLDILAPFGRLVVISFHSLEDRMVKRFMRDEARGGQIPRDLPLRSEDIPRTLRIIGKAIRASEAEVQDNPRARSAVLRVAEKLP